MEDLNKIYEESIDYIKNNIGAMLDEVPERLIQYWSVGSIANFIEDFETVGKTSLQFNIFMFALNYVLNKKQTRYFDINKGKMFKYFEIYNILLAIRKVGDMSDLQFEPCKLFDFENYDKIQIETMVPKDSPWITPFLSRTFN